MSRHLHQNHGQPDEVTYAKQDEARRERLRQRISAMFGTDTAGFNTLIRPDQRGFKERNNPSNAIYDSADPLSGADARAQFEKEDTDISGALRSQYHDDLGERYANAERALRFGAANTGNIGSTIYADARSKLNRDNALGGTNIEDAVRRSVSNLRTSREQVRSQALDLVNAGQGEEGVRSAAAGITSAAENARAARREQLFNDLFTNLAYTRVGQNNASQSAQLAALFNRGGGSFFPTSPSSGRVT